MSIDYQQQLYIENLFQKYLDEGMTENQAINAVNEHLESLPDCDKFD